VDGHRLSVENGPPGTRSKSEPPTPPLKVDYPSLGRPPPLAYSDFERRFQPKFMVGNFEYPYWEKKNRLILHLKMCRATRTILVSHLANGLIGALFSSVDYPFV